VRERLSALPWVEIRSIKPDQSKLRVTFGVNDKGRVNEQDLKSALGSRYGARMKILSIKDAESIGTSHSSAGS
jgi:hypothetical protein